MIYLMNLNRKGVVIMIKIDLKAENVEIRGFEEKTSKNGDLYLIVRVDDVAGNRSEFLDKNVNNKGKYVRGVVGDMIISLRDGKYWKAEVKEFIEKSDGGLIESFSK